MTNSDATLQAVFATQEIQLSESDREDLEQEQDILSIKHNVIEDFSDQQWQIVVSELGANLAGCLDIGIPNILLNAWKTTNELARYCDTQQYPPGDSVLVPLAEHVIESEHHPAIEIFIKKQRIGKIGFTVKLKLKLEGFLLKVQDCKIKSITAGTCRASGSIQLKKLTLAEVESRKITLPGRIDLGEGIVIAA
jgi:hypothetical protein